MSAVRIKKGDTVKVIAGKDKGKEGKVLSVNAKNHTALVEGVNMVTKHAKPSAANQQGGILHQEAPIDISNIAYSLKGSKRKLNIGIELKTVRKFVLLRQLAKLSINKGRRQ